MPTTPTPGAGGRLFADPVPTPDETSFQVDNTSDAVLQLALLQGARQRPAAGARRRPSRRRGWTWPTCVGASCSIRSPRPSGSRFHAVGDTGAAKQTERRRRRSPTRRASPTRWPPTSTPAAADAPAFFFHLGDVIYEFGEDQYYYDQFYEPFRAYDRPIFAIPGNHDGVVYGDSTTAPAVPTLQAFLRNFCAAAARARRRRRRARAHDDDPAGRLLHARRAARLDHRAVLQRAGGAGRDLHPGRPLPDDERRPADVPDRGAHAPGAGAGGGTAGDRARRPPPAGLGRRQARRRHRAGERHRQLLPAGRDLARRGAVGPRPSLPALHPADPGRATDPVHRRRRRRLRGDRAARGPEAAADVGRLHARRAPIVGLRIPDGHRRPDGADADAHLPPVRTRRSPETR